MGEASLFPTVGQSLAAALETIFTRASATTDGNVLFELYDQGPGVPEHERAGLFKKFSQATQDAKVKKQGTGFGLYLTDMIVKAHGGGIQVNPKPDGKTTVLVQIPLAEEPADVAAGI